MRGIRAPGHLVPTAIDFSSPVQDICHWRLNRTTYNRDMDVPFDDQPPDASPDRAHSRLECIGSFEAHTPEGEAYVVEIWTHFGAVHDRDRQRVAPEQLVLTTADGRGVDRVDQGEYCLRDSPAVSFSTDDPNAP
jgi:hypothetical protein